MELTYLNQKNLFFGLGIYYSLDTKSRKTMKGWMKR